jgi:hypothetical protein
MSNSVGGQNQTRSLNPPRTPQEHSHLQDPGQIGRVKATLESIGPHIEPYIEQRFEQQFEQQSPAADTAVSDPHPAFSAWWESWRESRTSLSVSPITKQS